MRRSRTRSERRQLASPSCEGCRPQLQGVISVVLMRSRTDHGARRDLALRPLRHVVLLRPEPSEGCVRSDLSGFRLEALRCASPLKEIAALSIRPRRRSRRASARPRSSAASIGVARQRADRDGDRQVAEVAVGIELAAGRRSMAGWSMSTALAIRVAAASAAAAVRGEHGRAVGDAEREGAAAAARGGDAAHRAVVRQGHRAVERLERRCRRAGCGRARDGSRCRRRR